MKVGARVSDRSCETLIHVTDTLESLAKIAGDSGGAILGAIAGALLGGNHGSGGKRFSGLDIKRVYFGSECSFCALEDGS